MAAIDVDKLITKLEKYRGRKIFVSLGMTFKDIDCIEEEESESNIIYLVTK